MTKVKKTIDANPTKEFFISMLVRDIQVGDAIGDLVDNCIDGAKRLRGNKKISNYTGLFINITISPGKFSISDNCGGIPIDLAEKYAFRFGRPTEMQQTDWSIGQFGIGMKRALFKLGKQFKVTSSTETDIFDMSENTDKWVKKKEWEFEFDSVNYPKKKINIEETGTIIEVTKLQPDIKSLFSDIKFVNSLKSKIELENLYNIHKGMKIVFNNNHLKSKQLNLKVSEEFSIGEWQKEYNKGDIKVRIQVGIGESNLKLGGWYIFCNDRLVVGPEQSELTGWTGRTGDGVAHYHSQFEKFRGFVFFEAKDSSLLPWNTTKTGMNRDAELFISVRRKMIEMMKPFMTFANALKKENESTFTGEKILHQKLESTKTINLSTIEEIDLEKLLKPKFEFPSPSKIKKLQDGEAKIIYYVAKSKVNKMKKFFNETSQNRIGEKSFDYVYNNEIENNTDYE